MPNPATEQLRRKTNEALGPAEDFVVAYDSLDWLIAQLACWPERVDEACTTNISFLMKSAAATLRERVQDA